MTAGTAAAPSPTMTVTSWNLWFGGQSSVGVTVTTSQRAAGHFARDVGDDVEVEEGNDSVVACLEGEDVLLRSEAEQRVVGTMRLQPVVERAALGVAEAFRAVGAWSWQLAGSVRRVPFSQTATLLSTAM